MTNKHTQGEWNVKTIYKNPFNIDVLYIVNPNTSQSLKESEANAKLICNAPNMLETLEVILRNFKLNFLHKTPITMQELEAGINIIQHTINKATN